MLFLAVLLYIWMTTGDSGQLKSRQLIARLVTARSGCSVPGSDVIHRQGCVTGLGLEAYGLTALSLLCDVKQVVHPGHLTSLQPEGLALA